MKELLWIASSVRKNCVNVTPEQVENANSIGATDAEIHDSVLITAGFCMLNLYVDGLATWAPEDRLYYANRAKRRAEEGYANYDASR